MRTFAFIYGIAFLLAGMGLFFSEPNLWIKGLHIGSGVLALVAGFSGRFFSRLYFQIFGVLYALLAIVSFWQGTADTWFNVIVAIPSLIIGYGAKD